MKVDRKYNATGVSGCRSCGKCDTLRSTLDAGARGLYSTVSADGLQTATASRALASEFLTSADGLAGCPRDDVPEVAFAGRSNAGKSSTLNRLTGRRQLARVSKTPGRTQLINFFSVNEGGRLVDLPGYGYARAAKARQQAWGTAVDDYLNRRENLACLVLVMDARHPLKPFDRDMIRWCTDRSLPLVVLLNKADKLKRNERAKVLGSVEADVGPSVQVLLFSAVTGMGAVEATAAVRERLQRPPAQP